jgi:type II secretory pathway component PulJ
MRSSLISAARRRAANARSAHSREAGISLVELLVSMMIFAIILTLVASMYSSMAHTVALGNSTNQSTKVAASTMSELTRVIRFATTNAVVSQPAPNPAIVVGQSEALTVYSYVDANATTPQPIKISFSVDSSRRLVESRYAATYALGFWTFVNPTAYSTRILTSGIGTQTGTELPLFSYQLVDGSTVTVPTTGLTATQAATIAAVQVNLKVTAESTSSAQPVTLQNTVGMSNLGFNRSGQ